MAGRKESRDAAGSERERRGRVGGRKDVDGDEVGNGGGSRMTEAEGAGGRGGSETE